MLKESKINAVIKGAQGAPSANTPLSYLQYLAAIRRHKWSVLGLALIAAFIAGLVSLTLPSVYKAKSILLIEPPQSKVMSIEDIYSIEKSSGEFFYTQVEILRSRDMAARVINKLSLEKHPEFASLLGRAAPKGNGAVAPPLNESEMQILVNVFLSHLSLNIIHNTHLVEIYFDALDPVLAANVVNQLAKSFLDSNLENQMIAASESSNWLIEKIGPLKEELVNAEKRLQAYREKEKLADLDGVRSLVVNELNGITSNLVDVRKRRSELEILLAQIQTSKDRETIPAIIDRDLVRGALASRADVEKRLAELSKRYGPEHPKMLAARSERIAAQKALESQLSSTVQSIEKEYEASIAKEKSLLDNMNRAKTDVFEVNSKEYQLKELKREVETRRRLYEAFFNRFQETDAIKDFDPVNARIAEHAAVPLSPFKPNRRQIVVFVFLVFLVAGASLAVSLELLKSTFRSVDDIEHVLKLPILGLIPFVKPREGIALSVDKVFSGEDGVNVEEFVHSIRTALLLSNVDHKKRITLVTSSVPAEGKSIVSGCLAVAVAQLEKVLLIDADMRRPSAHKQFEDMKNTRGLADVLTGSLSIDECIQHMEQYKVDVLAVGQIPPKPLDLLSSKRFLDLLDELMTRYDHIIIDSPPVHAVSDALVLSRHVDNVIFVIKSGSTSHYVARHAMAKLHSVDANILGAVLNQFDPVHSPYTNNYYQYMYEYGG